MASLNDGDGLWWGQITQAYDLDNRITERFDCITINNYQREGGKMAEFFKGEVVCLKCGSSSRKTKDDNYIWAAKEDGKVTARCNCCNSSDTGSSYEEINKNNNFLLEPCEV